MRIASDPTPADERRLMIFRVDYRDLCGLFAGLCTVVGLPADAEVVSAQHNFPALAMDFLVASASYKPVPRGAQAPCLTQSVLVNDGRTRRIVVEDIQ